MNPPKGPNQVRAILLGGLLPVIIFTVVEETLGTLWGLVVGMVFGVAEIAYEKIRHGKVDTITWIGNGMLLGLGTISLLSKDGIWFKLQPAILEGAMASVLLGSVVADKPFLAMLAEKQGTLQSLPEAVRVHALQGFRNITLRVGFFLLVHASLATWAALHWSTRAWALLKGVGFTASLVVYMLLEGLWLRRQLIGENRRRIKEAAPKKS